MREYIMSLIGATLICSVCTMLLPDQKGSGGYVKLLCGLCVLCIAISPLSDLVGALYDLSGKESLFLFGEDYKNEVGSGYGEIYDKEFIEAELANANDALSFMLCRDLGLSSDSFDVYVELKEEKDEHSIGGVTVVLYSNAIFADPHEITDYITSLLGCGCEIVYA